MLFNSLHFAVFFSIITTLFFLIPFDKRWLLLLVGSCYFYMAFVPIYIFILGFTIIIDYFAARLIENAKGGNRKFYLILSFIVNIGVLVFFKYYNFATHTLAFLLHTEGLFSPPPLVKILLPIGLSFHTFQAMSYTIEVYRGRQRAERHFGIYALYVMFYPQLAAGPIERPQNLLHQFRQKYDFDYDRVTSGLRLMLWGLFKKVVIADRLAIVVDTVYNDPTSYNSLSLIIATFFFSFQIFCDFSGYSDMAIGAARLMGFKLMNNFDRPYQSKSVNEFWKRWHISLSSWFRDYLYIPLGGNRVTIPRWYLNLFIVFLLSGLWHGANWTFVIWGGIHAFYIIFAYLTENFRTKISSILFFDRVPPLLSVVTTFTLVTFAWIFFRADNVKTAFYIAYHIFSGIPDVIYKFSHNQTIIEPLGPLKLSLFLIGIVEGVRYAQSRTSVSQLFLKQSGVVRWGIYYVVIFVILYWGILKNRQFLYFNF